MSLARAAGPCFSSLFTPPPPDSFPSCRRRTSTSLPCARAATTVRRSHTLTVPPAQPLAPPARVAAAPHPRPRRHHASRARLSAPSAARSTLPSAAVLHASTPQPQPHAAAAVPRRSSTRSALTRCSTICLFEMGREKRKGKEVVVEKPARKRTRAEKEAERAEMVAKAAEEQASGRARPFQIREDPRGRGRGMGRVRGARATRAATVAAAATDSDGSDSE